MRFPSNVFVEPPARGDTKMKFIKKPVKEAKKVDGDTRMSFIRVYLGKDFFKGA